MSVILRSEKEEKEFHGTDSMKHKDGRWKIGNRMNAMNE